MAMERVLLTVPEFMEATSLGRYQVYDLIRGGLLRTVKVGRSRRIPIAELREFVDRMVDAS